MYQNVVIYILLSSQTLFLHTIDNGVQADVTKMCSVVGEQDRGGLQ
jgi:hypothetical protein